MKSKPMYYIILIISSLFISLIIAVLIFINQTKFGKLPSGKRLERILQSPNYKDGKFHNISPTQQFTSKKSSLINILKFIFRDYNNLTPKNKIPSIKTNLKLLDKNKDLLVWFGHSSFYIQLHGNSFLIDPVLISASPISFFNKPFKVTNTYTPEDLPQIDYLIITHDHWDHLDYETVISLKEKVGKIITGLGVGEHFEYWGFDKNKIIELDWNDNIKLNETITIYSFPTRHFSGRGLISNKSLWSSFIIQSFDFSIFISGDGGYDTHFATIGKIFSHIDLAIIENGQYNEDWKYIHLMPHLLGQAAIDLKAKKIISSHNSKYALSKHNWKDPLNNAIKLKENSNLNILTPMIGEIINYRDSINITNKWWEDIE